MREDPTHAQEVHAIAVDDSECVRTRVCRRFYLAAFFALESTARTFALSSSSSFSSWKELAHTWENTCDFFLSRVDGEKYCIRHLR